MKTKKNILLLLCGLLWAVQLQAQFITTWRTTRANEGITIPVHRINSYTYNYDVDWGDGTSSTGVKYDASHTYTEAGIYTVSITGEFPKIYFNGEGSKDKILTIEQWGDNPWLSMDSAFQGCSNLQGNYSDAPDLSRVTNMTAMFYNATSFNHTVNDWDVSNVRSMRYLFGLASSFNQPLNDWDVSNVTDMQRMFYQAESFNQPLNNWDVSNVFSMIEMFYGGTKFNQSLNDWDISNVSSLNGMFVRARDFNQPLNDWDVSKVTSMERVFVGAYSFNQPLNDWDVSSVTKMYNMFNSAIAFDQSLNNWDVSNVTDMRSMFMGASSFNQPLNNWNVSNVKDMINLFHTAESFNQPLNNWDVSNVTNMRFMFNGASSFNQPIGNWNVSNVTSMSSMFNEASSFNQDISSWNILKVTNMSFIFDQTSMSSENYDALLIAWSQLELQRDISFHITATFCSDEATYARGKMRIHDNWSINDDGRNQECGGRPFITTWQTTESNESITIPTYGNGYNYTVDWGDGNISENHNGDATHTYLDAGTYTVSVMGKFPRIYFGNSDDEDKILSIEQWGDNLWTSMYRAFRGCRNLQGNYTDTPNLSNVTNLENMFGKASSFNGSVNDWNVSNVSNMRDLFLSASSFNQPIGDWDVSRVRNMTNMFGDASAFNQSIGDWDVSNVTEMKGMFRRAVAFNQSIENWNVSNVTDMNGMFDSASAFDQSLNNWDVSNVTDMGSMFTGTSSFNQPLNDWNVSNVTNMRRMFNSSMSTKNYDALLIAWSEQTLQNDVQFGIYTFYCSDAAKLAKEKIINDYNWTIRDAGSYCGGTTPFVTTWQTTEANESITIPTTGDGYDYTVDWGDGTITNNHEGNATHVYTNASTYTVSITGYFPRIYFNNQGKMAEDNKDKIQTIEQWGNHQWKSLTSAFSGCINLQGNFSDTPDLSKVTSLSYTFSDAKNFNYPINNWDVSNVTLMRETFSGATSFNQPINDWDVSNVTNMFSMFNEASSFNQPLNDWDTSSVTFMESIFYGASSFDQPLDNWDISNLTSLRGMLADTRMSTENYDALLIAWSEQTLQNNVQFDIDAFYCSDAATAAREKIISDYNWRINDEGQNCQELSVGDFAVSKTMLIYPNPAKTYVHIDNKNLQSEDTVAIIDLSGKVLYSVQVSEGRSHTTIDTSDLASGLYWIQVVSQQIPSVYKLMIQ